MTSPAFSPAQHPHYPAHTPGSRGGQFAPTGGPSLPGGGAAWAQAASSAIAGQRGLLAAGKITYKKHTNWSAMGVATSYQVQSGGTPIGTVHSDFGGSWQAGTDPTGPGLGQLVTGGLFGSSYHATRQQAVAALLQHVAANPPPPPSAPPAAAPTPPAVATPTLHYTGAGGGVYNVHLQRGGRSIGTVSQGLSGSWNTHLLGGAPLPGRHKTRGAAGQALTQYHAQHGGVIPVAPSPAPAVPTPPVPAGPVPRVYFTRTAVPAGSPPGTKGKLQYWVDHGGVTHGPYASKLAATKAIPKITAPPHKVSHGKDLVRGADGKPHPNQLASKVVKARPAGTALSTHHYARGQGGTTMATQTTADVDLRTLADLQGFSDVPEVITQAEMNRLAAAGSHYVLYRGTRGSYSATRGRHVTAADKQTELRTGEAFYGLGVYGNGYYFSTVRSEAVGYSDHTQGSVVRVAMPKTAKIIDRSAAQAEVQKLLAHRSASPDAKIVFADLGRWAIAHGYDAIRVDNYSSTYHVILNRSILKVQDK